LALVCDDERPIRTLLAILLEAAGFRVQVAVDGLDGLRAIREHPEQKFDLVVTDNHMPRLDGIGFVKALRASTFTGKIVVVSGLLNETNLAAYRELGVDGIFSKLEGMSTLGGIVKELFHGAEQI
jgi:DNA-binding response OmpR family regulator